MKVLKKLHELYDIAVSYEEFLDPIDEKAKAKHLHYFEKMNLTDGEINDLPKISDKYKILVFCGTDCKDCRIVLAIMAQIKRVLANFDFRIVPREGNIDLMKHIHKDHRIPMVVMFDDGEYKLVFNEVPNSFEKKQILFDEQSAIDLRIAFRKGEYKQEIINQILSDL